MRAAALVPLIAFAALAQDEEDPFAKARSIEACRKIYAAEGQGLGAAGMRFVSAQFSECTKRVMNVEVDRVLVPLKKSNAEKFKSGMAMQKSFNEAEQHFS